MSGGELKKRILEIYQKFPVCPSTTLDGKPLIIRYVGDSFIEAINNLVVDEAKKEYPMPDLSKITGPDVIGSTIVQALRLSAERDNWHKYWFGEPNET